MKLNNKIELKIYLVYTITMSKKHIMKKLNTQLLKDFYFSEQRYILEDVIPNYKNDIFEKFLLKYEMNERNLRPWGGRYYY